ncbi:hypothetical protein [Shouchella patagoniensis]|uniref:hypothetical protein n=1 Tax=Shouchella patagoniensis TaxID=228576 RepID=UPI000995CB87|nr:hypothetical protein [Shouchella patagoniensis]
MGLARWNLSSLCGGLDEKGRSKFVERIQRDLNTLKTKANKVCLNNDELHLISNAIAYIEALESLSYCIATEEIDEMEQTKLENDLISLKGEVKAIIASQQVLATTLTERQLTDWLRELDKPFVTVLNKMVRDGKKFGDQSLPRLVEETTSTMEQLATELRKRLTIEYYEEGEARRVPYVQASQMARMEVNEKKQKEFVGWMNKTFKDAAPLFARVYNQIIASRIAEYERRGIHYLDESLLMNGSFC